MRGSEGGWPTGGGNAEDGDLTGAQMAEMRQKYSKPDPETSAEHERARQEMNASSMEKWVSILGAKQRCMDLESKYSTPFKISDMIAKSYVTVETLEDMWAEAGKIREFQELDEELTALSARISRENESKSNNTKSFYRGTSIDELEDVLRRGGGISKGGRYKFTSLSTNLAVSMLFADSKDGVVLVYSGDSVRKTGVSIPVKYSHKYSTRNEDIARGLSLAYMHQDETRIPDGTEGPVLTAVVIDSEKHLSLRMLRVVKMTEDAGKRVSAIRSSASGASLTALP